MGFNPRNQFVEPYKTTGGIEYYIRTDPGTYSEIFRREGSQVTAQIIVRWSDSEQFVKEAVGYTVASATDRFKRTLPISVPFRPDLYAAEIQLVGYGTFADDGTFAGLSYNVLRGDDLAGLNVYGNPTYEVVPGDEIVSNWPRWGHAIYQVTFTHKPYRNLYTDEEINAYQIVAALSQASPQDQSPEFLRYVKKWDSPNVRELRRPDFGYETDDAIAQPIPIVGFVPTIEKDIFYQWFEVPYASVPRSYMYDVEVLLHVNENEFDGYKRGTLLYIGTKGTEEPYRSPSGDLYVDPVIQFRWNPFGWNHVYLPNRDGEKIVPIRAAAKKEGDPPGGPPYKYTDKFYFLFQPEQEPVEE